MLKTKHFAPILGKTSQKGSLVMSGNLWNQETGSLFIIGRNGGNNR